MSNVAPVIVGARGRRDEVSADDGACDHQRRTYTHGVTPLIGEETANVERFLEDADRIGGALTEGEQKKLIIENTRFVTHIAAGLPRIKREIPFEDLVAEGMLGLVQAARRFNPGRGSQIQHFCLAVG
jgi:DNA-directed RNA polymerase sigma subunit (sigma70/sigma32)